MKQVILVRDDLPMSKGKSISQGAHASVLAVRRANESRVEDWLAEGGKKITVAVTGEEVLQNTISKATDLPSSIIQDHGHTELEPNTYTTGAIGPCDESEVDNITGQLPLL